MALSPQALRSFFPHLPDEVLERIFGFGFHLWLREPWSFLCRAPSEPLVSIHNPFYKEVETRVLRRLCREIPHDGCVRGFRLLYGDTDLTLVPLAWHTVSVVSPRAVADDVVLDRARGLTWRLDGWKVYMSGMLQGLCDIDHAARPTASPFLPLSLSERPPIMSSALGEYRPEPPAERLFHGTFEKFFYHEGCADSECSFSEPDGDWRADNGLPIGAPSSSDSEASYDESEAFGGAGQ
jgi:hypothetical protein